MTKDVCCFGLASVITGVLGILFISTALEYSKTDEAVETKCNILSVKYTQNITDTDNMVTCDCGRNCKLPEGMCVKVYASANIDGKYITNSMMGSNVQTPISTCTFQENKALNSEYGG